MSKLTTRHSRTHVYGSLGLLGAFITLAMGACSNTESIPNSSNAGSGTMGGTAGASSGSSSGGKAGSATSAGSGNQAGSGGSGGGSAGAGGGGSAGSAGSGGTGGMACAADDECCDDPAKTEPGECGCGIADADTDGDGELNCKEMCPNDPNKTEPGMCLCGNRENDSDDDGEIDCKQGHFFEAEDGVLSEVDVPVTPIGGEGGAGSGGAGSGGADDGAGGELNLPTNFTIGDDEDASEGKYLEAPAGFTSDALPGPARASYMFEVPEDHDYVIWGRFYAPSRDHNRLWVKVDAGVWTKLRVTTGETWFWYVFHKEGEFDIPLKYTLTEGEHTLAVASDSDGVRVDRFYVTPILSGDRPVGDDTTCNPPHTVQIGDVCMSSCGMLMGNSCDAAMCAGKTLLPAYDCDVCCSTL